MEDIARRVLSWVGGAAAGTGVVGVVVAAAELDFGGTVEVVSLFVCAEEIWMAVGGDVIFDSDTRLISGDSEFDRGPVLYSSSSSPSSSSD